MVNSYSLLFAAAAVLAVSMPAIAFAEEGDQAVFARDADVDVYSRAPESDDLMGSAFARRGLAEMRRYRKGSKRLAHACKKVHEKTDRKACRKELKQIKASKGTRKSKITKLNAAAVKWRKAAKSYRQYKAALRRLTRTCRKAKGSLKKQCFKELKEIKSLHLHHKLKKGKLSAALIKYHTDKDAKRAYRKELRLLRKTCRKLKAGSDKKACNALYKSIKHSKDSKTKKLVQLRTAVSKYHGKRDLAEVEARSFDEELEARDFAEVDARDVEETRSIEPTLNELD